MTEATFILTLNAIRGVGYKSITSVLSTGIAFQEIIDHPQILSGLKLRNRPEIIKSLSENKAELLAQAESQLEEARKCEAVVISINDPNYPAKLKKSSEPPLILFCIGNVKLMDQAAVAVIGSRKGCEYGKLIAKSTVQAMGSAGNVIVSGLAIGIDTAAHEAALEFGIPTIAVLPDIATIEPKANISLAARIVESGGLLIAENVPNHRISIGDFIKRDRIQVALSEAIFPIQTSIDGGTMHAVHEAERSKTPIYCPDYSYFIELGNINPESPEIIGVQELIKTGMANSYTKNDYGQIENRIKARIVFLDSSADKHKVTDKKQD